MNSYVDDPAMVLTGRPADRDMTTAVVILVWRALNLKLSFKKGQRGQTIDWIGFRVLVECMRNHQAVTATLRPETHAELVKLLQDMAARNMLKVKDVRSCAGKLSNVARLLMAWRPFLAEFWAALTLADRTKSKRIWRRQLAPAIRWFLAFLDEEHAGITRTFRLSAYTTPASATSITLDGSPYGMGAFICVDGRPLEWFAVPLSSDDLELFGKEAGSCTGQQIWECLCALIALTVWRKHWVSDRCLLQVRGDNVSLLTMLEDLKVRGEGVTIIAREVALLVAGACYKPITATHVAGLANVVADGLSRRFDPEYQEGWKPHVFLAPAVEVEVPNRPKSWYKTWCQPESGPQPAARGNRRGRKRQHFAQRAKRKQQ